jgi:hypothetical protein
VDSVDIGGGTFSISTIGGAGVGAEPPRAQTPQATPSSIHSSFSAETCK